MYMSRTKPTTRDSMMVVTSSTVAENAVCSCEGRKIRKNRRETDKGLGVSGGPGIKRDFTRKNRACLVPRAVPAQLFFDSRNPSFDNP
jgi:hypothetical protein